MKKICKNCKFYKAPGDTLTNENDRGTCNCDKLAEIDETEGKLDDRLAYTDYEGYASYLWVGENFGCIHFKSK